MSAARKRFPAPLWSALVPVFALAAGVASLVFWSGPVPGLLVPFAALLLFATVLAAMVPAIFWPAVFGKDHFGQAPAPGQRARRRRTYRPLANPSVQTVIPAGNS